MNPFKGESWPPTIGDQKVTLNHLDLQTFMKTWSIARVRSSISLLIWPQKIGVSKLFSSQNYIWEHTRGFSVCSPIFFASQEALVFVPLRVCVLETQIRECNVFFRSRLDGRTPVSSTLLVHRRMKTSSSCYALQVVTDMFGSNPIFIKGKSWVPLGEYPRCISTYTTYRWVM